MKDLIELIGMLIVATVIACIVVVGICIPIYYVGCNKQAVSFEDHRFDVIAGCMVKHNGQWIPLENVRFLKEGD